MTEKNKAGVFSLKAIYLSIREALTFRQIDRDPNNRDLAIDHGGNDAESGPRVGRALQLSTVWACVRLISNAIATMPLFVYERADVDGRETRRIAREHPLYKLLHDSPNADMTAFEFRRCLAIRLLTWGNFYALKTRVRGKIIALDPLDPGRMTVRWAADGSREYTYADARGQQTYSEADIWHVMGFSEDGLVGLSPIAVGWRSMNGAHNVAEAASNLFGGALRPSGVVSIDAILDKTQREQMKVKLLDGVFGDRALGRMHLLEGGAKYQQLTISPLDAQMMEQMNASVEDLCRWFGVPPAKIGHGTSVSNWGTGREQQNLGFLQEVLDPDLVMIEQSIAKSLLLPAERGQYFAEFAREARLRMDSASRAAYYATMTQNGIFSRNFCRGLENLPPVEGGDDLTVQSNLIPLDKLGEATRAQDTVPDTQDAATIPADNEE